MQHLAILPIAVPLLAGAVMIPMDDQRGRLRATLGIASALALLVFAFMLAWQAHLGGAVSIYRLGNWPVTFGIVLVVDRLAALMLVLTAVLGLSALLFSLTRWQRMGPHFHALFQFQLMGLNGAFLTGDLFNLFVFFEVLLAASYGLALHGSGIARVKAGLHYISINLAASLLFLIGVSMIYGVTGTLNMGDLASRIPAMPAEDRPLLEAGAAILGMAFLTKAAMWPLGFWLGPTYAAASPPAAAIFSLMSKVGVYAILRLSLLLFGEDSGASAGFGGSWLLAGGIMTIGFGAVSVLATQDLSRLAGACVLISSGTLLAAIGAGQVAVTSGALIYLASSALAIGALFLLIELLERGREVGADVLAVTLEAFGDGEGEEEEEEANEVGTVIPATMAILGISFMCCALVLAGLPPLSGFIGKFAMLSGILNPAGLGEGPPSLSLGGWAFALLRPDTVRVRRLGAILRLARHVAVDVIRSNLGVAQVILFRRKDRRSGFVRIQLALRDPQALAVLAIILTATPGTAWLEFDSEEGWLLLHVLDLIDEASWARIVQERYEEPLMEIFQ